jgi:hypothetical protein
MEIENLRYEIKRLNESLNEISTYKTKFRINQEISENHNTEFNDLQSRGINSAE